MVDSIHLAEEVAQLLGERKLTIALAESCTGGLIAKTFTDLPGSSSWFRYGVVSYSNEAKEKILGVHSDTLLQYGAVSAQTAKEMAQGVRKICDVDLAISVTGVAGPGGGTPEKPVGLVYIGFCTRKQVQAFQYNFTGNRTDIRNITCETALRIIRDFCLQ